MLTFHKAPLEVEGFGYMQETSEEDKALSIKVLFESSFSKEIQITLNKEATMKEHSAPKPISVEVFSGHITFSVGKREYEMPAGSIIALAGGVPHSLYAHEKSIVRLSLHHHDTLERVKGVAGV